MIGISRGLQNNGLFFLMVLGGGFWTFFYFKKRSRAMREFLDRAALKIPVIGPILNKAAIARYARTLSTMFSAGVPLVEALESGRRCHRQHRLREGGAEDARRSVHRSAPAALNGADRPVPEHGQSDDRRGEESGSLDEMSGKVATFYEAEVDNAVDAMSSLLEPMIMVILGGGRWRTRHRHVPADIQAGLSRLTHLFRQSRARAPRPRAAFVH